MSLPHGNADRKYGFSENKRTVDNCANLAIVTINGIWQVKSYSKRFDSNPSNVPLTRELIKAVQHSHKTYTERLQWKAEDWVRQKRKSAESELVMEKRIRFGEKKQCLGKCLESLKAMPKPAHGLIKMGLTCKDKEKGATCQGKCKSCRKHDKAGKC